LLAKKHFTDRGPALDSITQNADGEHRLRTLVQVLRHEDGLPQLFVLVATTGGGIALAAVLDTPSFMAHDTWCVLERRATACSLMASSVGRSGASWSESERNVERERA
jgi:hypothetical protein